jgi:hypothetical protein
MGADFRGRCSGIWLHIDDGEKSILPRYVGASESHVRLDQLGHSTLVHKLLYLGCGTFGSSGALQFR